MIPSIVTFFGKAVVIAVSRPCSAMLASRGEITPPCGVPSSEGKSSSPSMILALSQVFTARLKFFQQGFMVDTVKALSNVSIKHKLLCVLDTLMDCFYRIMG